MIHDIPDGIKLVYPSPDCKAQELLESSQPIISLWGSVHGIVVSPTWHNNAIRILARHKFKGIIYVPCRIDDDLGDYTHKFNSLEKNIDIAVLQKSTKVIYWHPSSIPAALYEYSTILLQVERQRAIRQELRTVHLGSDHFEAREVLKFAVPHLVVHESLEDLCKTALTDL